MQEAPLLPACSNHLRAGVRQQVKCSHEGAHAHQRGSLSFSASPYYHNPHTCSSLSSCCRTRASRNAESELESSITLHKLFCGSSRAPPGRNSPPLPTPHAPLPPVRCPSVRSARCPTVQGACGSRAVMPCARSRERDAGRAMPKMLP